MKNKIILLYTWFVRSFLFFLPDIPICMRFRGWLYGLFMKSCGKDFQVTHDAIIRDLARIEVGSHCFIGNNSFIMGSGTIYIDDEVLIAPHVIIISGNHGLKDGSFRYGTGDHGHIHIGRGAWIAGNSTICKGGYLPDGSVLSANSFLNKSFNEKYSLYGGVPARFIKNIEDKK